MLYSVNGVIWNVLDTDSECEQCKWCDMEWTYWTQTVSVYSVNGVIWNVLTGHRQ